MSGVNTVRKLAKRAMHVELDDDQAQILWLECRANLTQRKMRSTIKHIESCSSGSIDTLEREDLLVSFAQVLTGDSEAQWPCNGDSEETSGDFYEKLKKGIKERGYRQE
jgi:hypothetical protein